MSRAHRVRHQLNHQESSCDIVSMVTSGVQFGGENGHVSVRLLVSSMASATSYETYQTYRHVPS